jgi:NitT/TauT family transport system permease protein
MARAFRLTGFVRMRHVVIPQLAPYFAAASRSGLSIAWKIVLVAELIGRPNGVGFVLGSAFSLFDLTKILSYTLTFVALMLTIENLLVQPLERRAQRWRRRA